MRNPNTQHPRRHALLSAPPDAFADVVTSLKTLGELLASMGRYAEAKPLFVEAIGLLKRNRPRHDAEIAQVLNCLALVCLALGRADKAEPLFAEVGLRLSKADVYLYRTSHLAPRSPHAPHFALPFHLRRLRSALCVALAPLASPDSLPIAHILAHIPPPPSPTPHPWTPRSYLPTGAETDEERASGGPPGHCALSQQPGTPPRGPGKHSQGRATPRRSAKNDAGVDASRPHRHVSLFVQCCHFSLNRRLDPILPFLFPFTCVHHSHTHTHTHTHTQSLTRTTRLVHIHPLRPLATTAPGVW